MTDITVTIVSTIDEIGRQNWTECITSRESTSRPENPFITFEFLKALEVSKSVGEYTGWLPRYVVAKQGDLIIGVAPMYLKTHSQGEYVFDHQWAQAFETAGGDYYPKLQIASPFTPVTGPRLLTLRSHEKIGKHALLNGIIELVEQNNISSIHMTFCTESDVNAAADHGLLHRTGIQYHWSNDDYESFDAFLSALSAKKRKEIRRERRIAQNFGGEIHCLSGDQIQSKHWDAFWLFYQDTSARKWGTPYLTRQFFDEINDRMRNDILLVLASKNDKPIAGALHFIGEDTLFGRHWGCVEDHPCLHFELCYYQAIEYAIEHRLKRVEAGAQGGHKVARGYLPKITHSMHYISNPDFKSAVNDFLAFERHAIDEHSKTYTGPFKITKDTSSND